MNHRFPRSQRLTGNTAFRDVLRAARRCGNSVSGPGFRLSVGEPCADGTPRLGMRIARKHLRRSVDRSALRRLVREAFRQRDFSRCPRQLVFHSSADLATTDREQLRCALVEALTELSQRPAGQTTSTREPRCASPTRD